jgi:hypothetical protein
MQTFGCGDCFDMVDVGRRENFKHVHVLQIVWAWLEKLGSEVLTMLRNCIHLDSRHIPLLSPFVYNAR